MDYETLYTLLPKEPKKWQVQDVVTWLEFIELPQLSDKFIAQTIDGSILELLEDKDLEEELGITQKIVKKKIMNWLANGLKEYTQFIKDIKEKPTSSESNKEQVYTLQKEKQQLEFKEGMLQNSVKNTHNHMSSLPLPVMQSQVEEEESSPLQQQQQQQSQSKSLKIKAAAGALRTQKSEHQLVLQPMEGQQNNFYCIKEVGAKIGRHSSNQILILEENISRYHAEVSFENGVVMLFLKDEFFLQDIGSTTGTYIKIQKKLELETGMLVELGSNLFNVTTIECLENEASVQLTIIEGPNQDEEYVLKLNKTKPNVMIGRKNTADIPFPEDHHLSNLHAKFYLIDSKMYIEDYSSTNGTWLRLSAEGTPSLPYPLHSSEQHVIRIGTTNQYLCQQNSINITELSGDSMCIICCEKERDALYLPCKHNAACLRCSKNLVKCPICRVKIQEQIRIYKN